MKIIKVLEKTELVIVDLEVNLGKEKRNGLTLCVKYNGDYYPLNTAHDGRPILMNKDNIIKIITSNIFFTKLSETALVLRAKAKIG